MAKGQTSSAAKGGFVNVHVSLVGVSPLLLHPMTEELLLSLPGAGMKKGARRATHEASTVEDIAADRIIKDESGRMGLPSSYLFAALKGAGRMVTFSGKKNISTAASSLLPSFFQISEDFLPFLNQEATWQVDIRRGVNPTTKGAMAIVRPKFPVWGIAATCEVDTNEIDIEKIRELFTVAGRTQGLASFRPSCGGQFGKFRVENWEVSEVSPELKAVA